MPRLAATSQQSLQRQERSALSFHVKRHGGNVILHHRHIQPVLSAVLRTWLAEQDGHPGQPLFPARAGGRLSRDAIEHRLAKHAATAATRCPSLKSNKSRSTCTPTSPSNNKHWPNHTHRRQTRPLQATRQAADLPRNPLIMPTFLLPTPPPPAASPPWSA
jgi:hypothetical protein